MEDWITQLLANTSTPGYLQPTPGVTPDWQTPDQSLGAVLQPTGTTAQPGAAPLTPPAPQEAPGQEAPGGAPQQQAPGGFQQQLLKGLQGVKAPAAPDVVKPSTPAAPQTKPVDSGALLQLLGQISSARAPARPVTLGGALGTGRY